MNITNQITRGEEIEMSEGDSCEETKYLALDVHQLTRSFTYLPRILRDPLHIEICQIRHVEISSA